jgi:hypothetical protein
VLSPQEVEQHWAYRLTRWLLAHGEQLLLPGLAAGVLLLVAVVAYLWFLQGARLIAAGWVWSRFLEGFRHRGARGEAKHSPEYDAYLSSAAWRRRRGRVLRQQGGRCAVPGCSAPAVDVHHAEGYARLGRERPDELLGVCERHHRQLHAG